MSELRTNLPFTAIAQSLMRFVWLLKGGLEAAILCLREILIASPKPDIEMLGLCHDQNRSPRPECLPSCSAGGRIRDGMEGS